MEIFANNSESSLLNAPEPRYLESFKTKKVKIKVEDVLSTDSPKVLRRQIRTKTLLMQSSQSTTEKNFLKPQRKSTKSKTHLETQEEKVKKVVHRLILEKLKEEANKESENSEEEKETNDFMFEREEEEECHKMEEDLGNDNC